MDAHDRWFTEQVLPLEAALTAYLRRVWSDPSEIEDLRQEVYVRVYEAGRAKKPPVASFFVFAVAKNLLIDRLRHRRVVTIDLVADLEALNVFSDEVPVDRALSGRQELARLEWALAELPPRWREVFLLRKVEGLSQRETAQHLGLSESTIEKHIGKAMQALAGRFFGGDRKRVDGLANAQDSDLDEAGGSGRS